MLVSPKNRKYIYILYMYIHTQCNILKWDNTKKRNIFLWMSSQRSPSCTSSIHISSINLYKEFAQKKKKNSKDFFKRRNYFIIYIIKLTLTCISHPKSFSFFLSFLLLYIYIVFFFEIIKILLAWR